MMKYLTAVAVCAAEIIAFALVFTFVIRTRPGAFLYIMFIAIVLFPTWQALTRRRGSDSSKPGTGNTTEDGPTDPTPRS